MTWNGTAHWDNFLTNYDAPLKLLQAECLSQIQAQEFYNAMLDIYHSHLPHAEERAALQALILRFTSESKE